jgi:hypothetical protein
MFLHCARVYAEMYRQSKRALADGHTTIVVYEGMLTALVTETIGLPVPYYTAVRRKLLDMGCVRQLRRGGGTAPSQWELIKEPTADLWAEAPPLKTPPIGIDVQMLQMFSSMDKRMGRVEQALGIRDFPLPKEG